MSVAKGADTPVQNSPASNAITNLRAKLRGFLETNRWEYFILSVILLNAVVLGLETNKNFSSETLSRLIFIDKIILAVFVIELSLRIFAYGRKFWTDAWSLFDFVIVAIALMPATGNLSVLRALRILRALRLISAVKSMRNVVAGLLRALPGMGSITVLLLLICYVFSVMATMLFGEKFPEFFGSLPASAYTLFQIMTLDGWSSEIVRPVMKEFPYAWIYFVIFILVASFMALNLFIGIIVEGLQSEHVAQRAEQQEQTSNDVEKILEEVRALREEIIKLRRE